MRNGGFGRGISRNMAGCFVIYIAYALAAEMFSGNASCYLLLIGIIFWMTMPYSRWGLKIMRRKINWGRWVAVDFHPRAKKDYLNNRPKVNELPTGNYGRQPLLAGDRPLFSAILVCSRFASTESGRQPENP